MRYNIHGIARDSFGRILPNEDINVYINGSSVPAIVYDNRTSTTGLSSVQTDTSGKFTIYFDSEDYQNLNTTFDLVFDGDRINDIEVFKVDNRVLNTSTVDEIAVDGALSHLNQKFEHIDGGTF